MVRTGWWSSRARTNSVLGDWSRCASSGDAHRLMELPAGLAHAAQADFECGYVGLKAGTTEVVRIMVEGCKVSGAVPQEDE